MRCWPTTSVILHLVLPPYLDSDRVPVRRVAASRRDLVEDSGGVWRTVVECGGVHRCTADSQLESYRALTVGSRSCAFVSLFHCTAGILFSLAAGSSPQLSALDFTLHCLSHDKVSKPTTARFTEPHGSTISYAVPYAPGLLL
ncbi:hypothetical protein F5Y07DRAFT_232769 [Xylaria sp. FL0933]|nr:hypothetical protein F5Y07DRAFT_232769 [Xylaria sp. FL0933]